MWAQDGGSGLEDARGRETDSNGRSGERYCCSIGEGSEIGAARVIDTDGRISERKCLREGSIVVGADSE
jgi:hypothetical protein